MVVVVEVLGEWMAGEWMAGGCLTAAMFLGPVARRYRR